MDKNFDLIGKLFITYSFLLSLCFLFYGLVVLPTNGAEKVNAIVGLLGWSATIFAPIAALFLLNNWKDQEKFRKTLELYEYGVSSLQTTLENLSTLEKNYNAFSIGLRFPEKKYSSIQKVIYRNRIIEDNKNYIEFKISREDHLLDSQLHCYELSNKYITDFFKCMNENDKLKEIFIINTDVMDLFYMMLQDSDNCAHMLNCQFMKNKVLKSLKKLTSK